MKPLEQENGPDITMRVCHPSAIAAHPRTRVLVGASDGDGV